MTKFIAILVAVVLICLLLWTLFSQLLGTAVLILAGIGIAALAAGILFWSVKARADAPGRPTRSESRRSRAAQKDLRQIERRIGRR